ncbi:MAG: hypothetical protein AAGF71_10540, partial [Pseudomonadota bacterium]
GLLTPCAEPETHFRKPYALTEYAIDMVPLMAELARLGLGDTPCPGDAQWRLFYGGGPKLWSKWQTQLRHEHIHGKRSTKSEDLRYRLQIATTAALTGAGPLCLPKPAGLLSPPQQFAAE